MGKLEELEEALYGKEAGAVPSRRNRQFVLPSAGKNVRTSWDRGIAPGVRWRLVLSRTTAIAVLAAALFFVGGAAFVFFYLGSERSEAEVVIGGRDVIEAGEEFTLPIVFRNTSSVNLEEADLAIIFPEGALVRDGSGPERPVQRMVQRIGILRPGEEGRREIALRLFGRESEMLEIGASLHYRPQGLRARFSSQASKIFTIGRVPLSLFWEIPEQVTPRHDIPIILRYGSQSRQRLDGLWIRIDYPPGFAIRSADPKASFSESLWDLGSLEPGAEGTIVLSGRFEGSGGEIQSLGAGLGVFNELTKEWRPWRESAREIKLSASPFLLETTLDGKREGVVRPGETLLFSVRYENRSSVGVKNVSVRAAVEGASVDPATLSIENGGVFDFQSRTIVWGPGGTQELLEVAPAQGGELRFRVGTRERPAVRTAEDKNFIVRVRAMISSPRLPKELEGAELSPEDVIEFKLATVALFSGRAVFRTSPISNTGPLPPKVGEKTSYAVVWELRNLSNEIENAEVKTSLPPNVRWEGVVSPQDADIRFDPASGEVRWRIGKIPPGTGALTTAKRAAFQVSIVPSEVDIGKVLTLTTESRFSGRDTFTSEDLTLQSESLDTELTEDSATKSEEWKVTR